jgi:hypothetical protein
MKLHLYVMVTMGCVWQIHYHLPLGILNVGQSKLLKEILHEVEVYGLCFLG